MSHAPADSSEFEALLSPVLERAYGVALRLTRDATDAEDLVQDAALLAFRGFRTFKRGSNFRAWFLRVMMNAFLSSLRKKRPEREAEPLDEIPNAYIQRQAIDLNQPPQDVARSIIDGLETEDVQRAVDELPEEFRASAALYFIEDLSYKQIAEILDIPVGTVRSRLHRGRALLQRRLWRLAQDHGLVPAAKGPPQ